jgi:hypothetical protein
MAQAVPSATRLPCVADLPYGWGVSGAETVRGRSEFTLGIGGSEPVTVTLTASCPTPAAGAEQIEFDGGCVTYASTVDVPEMPSFDPGGGLSFVAREDLVAEVAEGDQVLCGADVPPCP